MSKKRNNWFTKYHEIPQLGIEGKRNLKDRLSFYVQEDFANSHVIDFGCNMGQMSFQAADWGASKVLGVEYDLEAVNKAKEINQQLGYNINFVKDDLDSNFFWNSIDCADVSLFLAIIDTKELENRYGILAKVCAKTKKVMYFEGHGKQDKSKYLSDILHFTDFSKIEYCGLTPVNRPFFRCAREFDHFNEIENIINQGSYNKIGIVGKPMAGKTALMKSIVNDTKYTLIDDLVKYENNQTEKIEPAKIDEIDRYIIFDYKALDYCDDLEVVFFLTPQEENIGQTRPSKNQVDSPTIKNITHLEKIYTVKNY